MEKITISKNCLDTTTVAKVSYPTQTLLCSYDPEITRRSLDILLKNKINEVRQIAEGVEYLASDSDNNREEKVIQFCLELDTCFKDISKIEIEDWEIHRCMNLMGLLTKHNTLNETLKLLLLAYNIAEDFKLICEREQ
jgi:hypothetical protein